MSTAPPSTWPHAVIGAWPARITLAGVILTTGCTSAAPPARRAQRPDGSTPFTAAVDPTAPIRAGATAGAGPADPSPPSAASPPPAAWLREDCRAAGDEDLDGLADCADDDCNGPYSGCPEDCTVGGDEDGDGLRDCEDADCAAGCVEDCTDRYDNDRDGALNCDDLDCALHLPCWDAVRFVPTGGVQLAGTVHWRASDIDRSWWRAFGLRFDTLEVHGEIRTSGGGALACGASLHGLRVAERSEYARAWPYSTETTYQVGLDSVLAIGSRCPAPTPREVAALTHWLETSGGAGPTLSGLPELGLQILDDRLQPLSAEMGPMRTTVTRASGPSFTHSAGTIAWRGEAPTVSHVPDTP